MRPHGQTKLGFFPLPVAEAKRLRILVELSPTILGPRSLCRRWRGLQSIASRRNRPSLRN